MTHSKSRRPAPLTASASLALASLCWSSSALALQPAEGADRSRASHLTVATDLSPWLLSGFSAIVGYEPAGAPAWRVSAELWSMSLPSFAIELAEQNVGEGWSHHVSVAGALTLDRAIADTGWRVGGLVNVMRARVDRGTAAQAELTVAEVLVRGGYRWLPLGQHGPSIEPWLGVGPQVAATTLPVVDGQRYALAPVQLIATVHIGWRF